MNIKKKPSPNFSKKTRSKTKIKYVIFHYTGMQTEIESLKRLRNIKTKVSCHYHINRKGEISQLVKENRVAWHAGKSRWKDLKNLNESSIGIELENKGHRFGYQNFPNLQIKSLIKLCKRLKKKYNFKKENFLGHSDISPMRKIDPGEKFPWNKLSKYKIGSWYKTNKRNYNLNDKSLQSLFFKNIYKIGYRYFFQNIRNTKDKKIIKVFQQRYCPNKITGKIDQKLLKISHFLAYKNKKA